MSIESSIPTPAFVVYEERLRNNLRLISDVAQQSGAVIIMAFKANALWRTFNIFAEYGIGATASSLNELRLGREYLTKNIHSYCPAYTDQTIDEYLAGSTHITFNTIAQFERFKDKTLSVGVSPGIRVNPQCSVIETDIYNPAMPGSRFGVTAQQIGQSLPHGIEGLHFHALCESSSYDLQKVLDAFEAQFGHFLPHLKWVNMGGGHLMTRKDYDTQHLISLIKDFRLRHPNIQVILEPGSAFTWQTGDLLVSVVDIVENDGIKTAIIDASFACHMPDTLEMPYLPAIAESAPDGSTPYKYRLGGNSCLSGDFKGDWWFNQPLKPGDRLTLLDMNHYTTVKTTMFNGIQHPDIYLVPNNNTSPLLLRHFDYNDYKNRMS